MPFLPAVGEILPPPFAWVVIPEGSVTLAAGSYLASDTTFHVPEFSIGKYPITNAQYRVFIEAGGYENPEWWTEQGEESFLRSNQQKSPRYLGDLKFSHPKQPVLGLSSFEAIAFANWLQQTAQRYYPTVDAAHYRISLPTEQQWQRAAQAMPDGTDSGRRYPWGDVWDGEACQHCVGEARTDRTAQVDAYENRRNQSPCGVVDLAGNAWEWCLTHLQTGRNDIEGPDLRVQRGGSWFDSDPERFQVTARHMPFPGWLTIYWTFRICLSYTPS